MKDNLNNGNITVFHVIFIIYMQFYIHPHYHQMRVARTEKFSHWFFSLMRPLKQLEEKVLFQYSQLTVLWFLKAEQVIFCSKCFL